MLRVGRYYGSLGHLIGAYRKVISGARNRSFHDIFAFARPFNVRLSGEAIRMPTLRLFQQYSSKPRPALDYEDRDLVDLLSTFMRVDERPAPLGFWENNLDVMRGVVAVVVAIRDALLLVRIEPAPLLTRRRPTVKRQPSAKRTK